MNKAACTLTLSVLLALGTQQILFAADDGKDSIEVKSPMNKEAWEKVNKAQAEAEQAKALAQKVEAETRLQEAIFKQKMTEMLDKIRLESALAAEGAEKTRNQAHQAEAEASLNEALLRSIRARNEMAVEKNPSEAIWEARIAGAHADKAEAELRLAKIIMEREKLAKTQ